MNTKIPGRLNSSKTHRSKPIALATGTGILLLLAGVTSNSADIEALRELVGMLTARSARIVTGWTVAPAGALTTVRPFPLRAIWAPDGEHLLISTSVPQISSLQVVGAQSGSVVQTIQMPSSQSLFLGLAYSRDGRHAYAAGGGDNLVHTFTVAADGTLTKDCDIPVAANPAGAPAGTGGKASNTTFPAGIALSSDERSVYVALNLAHAIGIVDLAQRRLVRTVQTGGYPYDVAVAQKRIIVTNWADATVTILDENTLQPVALALVGYHPTAIATHGTRVAIANANQDTVSLFTLADPRHVATIAVGHGSLFGSSPQDLAFSGDGKRLYVALAGDNAIAVVELSGTGGRAIGRVPAGWYPTGVRVDDRRHSIVVLSAKGFGAGPNATGFFPDPTRTAGPHQDGYRNSSPDLYVGSMMKGLLSRIPIPNAAQLAEDTAQVSANNRPVPSNTNLPRAMARIKHVIYVIRENRTYDQVFGDEKFGESDPHATLFGREVTPNAHALAERFGLFDNFYVDAEGSSDGHNWSLAADASDYTERTKSQPNRAYDHEGAAAIAKVPGRYLWDAAAAAHISYRDYGEWYSLSLDLSGERGRPILPGEACAGPIATNYLNTVHTWQMSPGPEVPAGKVLCLPAQRLDDDSVSPALVGHYDPRFRGWDLRYSDVDREAEWKREFDQFVAADDLPQLEIVRLGNDHTIGTALGGYTPQAMAADNDLALGRLVDAVSHSRYWLTTAIFVVEDDASDGGDHVDAHRSPILIISPYGSHAAPTADHSLADTSAMLKTIEVLLGMTSMSHFDAAAHPMVTAFGEAVDPRPYNALAARISTTAKNTRNDAAARASSYLDLVHPDAVDPDLLNAIIANARTGGLPVPRTRAQTSRGKTAYHKRTIF